MYYIFVNPASQSGKGATLLNEATGYLKSKQAEFEIHTTQKDKGIDEEVEEILKKEETAKIIVMGGDGTLNHCINGIKDFSRVELSVLPTGSGNDFVANKDLPKAMEERIDNILNRKRVSSIDVGLTTVSNDGEAPVSRRFIVSSGLGYDAEICYSVDHSSVKNILNKIGLGKLAYIFIGVRNIFTNKLSTITLTVNNKTAIFPNSFFVAAMNQPCEGGGVHMAPDARDTDGELGFTLFYNMTHLKGLFTIPKIYSKKHIGRSGVAYLTGKEIEITCSEPKMVHCDGEVIGTFKNVHIILDRKITFVY